MAAYPCSATGSRAECAPVFLRSSLPSSPSGPGWLFLRPFGSLRAGSVFLPLFSADSLSHYAKSHLSFRFCCFPLPRKVLNGPNRWRLTCQIFLFFLLAAGCDSFPGAVNIHHTPNARLPHTAGHIGDGIRLFLTPLSLCPAPLPAHRPHLPCLPSRLSSYVSVSPIPSLPPMPPIYDFSVKSPPIALTRPAPRERIL